MYAVLGGADFGAGFWDLTAGGARARRPGARADPALDEPGVGGQPRLADLRARDRRGPPSRSPSARSSRRSSSRSSSPRWGSSCAAPPSPCAARPRRSARRACSARSSRSPRSCCPFFLGTVLGGIAAGEVDVADPRRRHVDAWTGPDVDRRRRARGAHRRLPRRRVPRRRRAARRAAGPRARVPRPGARHRRRDRRRLDRRAARPALGRPAAVRRAHLAAPGWSPCSSRSLAGAATLALIWTWRFELARWTARRRGRRGRRRLVAGDPPRRAARASRSTRPRRRTRRCTALVVSVALGLLILVPSLWYLYRLVLPGTLDQSYEPLDQRFRPTDGDQP